MKTVEHLIPKAINPQAVLNAWQRHSGHLTHSVGRSLLTHHVLCFTLQNDYFKEHYRPVDEEELAGFIAGYVAACIDHEKASNARMMDMLGEIFEGDDDTLILSDDDSPQMMPGPDQFR